MADHDDCIPVKHVCPWDGTVLRVSSWSAATGSVFFCPTCARDGKKRLEAPATVVSDAVKEAVAAWRSTGVISSGDVWAQIPWEQYMRLKKALNDLDTSIQP